MTEQIDILRRRMVQSCDALKAFHGFVIRKDLTVLEVFEDPELVDRAESMLKIFDILPNIIQSLGKKDGHASSSIDKLLLELSCCFEWTIRMFLYFFSKLTPYKETKLINEYIAKIGAFLNSIRSDDPELFDYFVLELQDLVTLICLFFDQQRLSVKLELNHFSTRKLSLTTRKIRSNEDFFEPDLEFDLSLENVLQVESLFITGVQLIASVGKPFISTLGLRKSCEMMSNLVANCISFASPQMLVASLRLFRKFYPVKCVQLNPEQGYLYKVCWITSFLFKSPTFDHDLAGAVLESWELLIKRLEMEKQDSNSKKEQSNCDALKIANALTLISNLLSKMSPSISTQLASRVLPQVFHKLLDIIEHNKQQIPEAFISDLYTLFSDKLSHSLPYDTQWFTLVRRLLLINYKAVNGSLQQINGNGDVEMAEPGTGDAATASPSAPLSEGRTLLDDICKENSKIITMFQKQKSLEDVIRLHNMYAVEWESIMSLRANKVYFSNLGNIHKIKEVTSWIADFVLKNIIEENVLKYVFHLSILVVKALKDSTLSDSATELDEKLSLIFLLPYFDDKSPQVMLSSINLDWLKKQLIRNKEITILSLHGLALVQLRSDPKYRTNILVDQLVSWKGDETTFNQLLSYVLHKNRDSQKQISKILEKKENLGFTARSIGLVTCILSQSVKALSFTLQSDSSPCDLLFYCKNCATYEDSHKNSSLPENAECTVMEIFQKVINSRDPKLITGLAQWSAKRVLRHCGIDGASLASIFKIFQLESEEVKVSLEEVFIPLIMDPYKHGSFRASREKQILRAFNKVFASSKRELTLDQDLTEIANIASFAKFLEESKLYSVLLIFCRKIWNDSSLKDKIRSHINQIVKHKGLEPTTLFYRHKSNICTELINIVLDEITPLGSGNSFGCIQKALALFTPTEDTLPTMFTDSLSTFFSAAVHKANANARALLDDFIENSDLSYERLLTSHSQGLPNLFVSQTKLEAVEKTLCFLESMTEGKDLESIFGKDFRYSLLLVYHQNPKVTDYVLYKIYISKNCKIDRESFQDEELRKMLESQMGGYIIAINKLLLKLADVKEEKQLAIESLGDVLELLGPRRVASSKMIIMGILLTAFNRANGNRNFLKSLLKVWSQFLSNCSPSDIGPHLSVICKDLIPFFDVDQEETAKVFKNLIVNKEKEFQFKDDIGVIRSYLQELHFLPQIGPMKEVIRAVNEFTKLKTLPANQVEYLKENLKNIDDLLKTNNPDVKVKHMEKLRVILKDNKQALRCLSLPNKEASTNPLITQLIGKLLADSSIHTESLSIGIAECLGEIGAIDPGRLDLSLLAAPQNSKGGFIDFDDLPVRLLTKLANTLDSIDQSRVRDCLCYSIQETLKSYKITRKDKTWRSFPPEMQRNIEKFLDSRYLLVEIPDICASPVLQPDITYEDWLYRWSLVLINLIKRPEHKSALEACAAILKYNSTIGQFLLPNIFWMALQDSSETQIKDCIVEEINALIQSGFDREGVTSETPHPLSSPLKDDPQQSRSDFEKVRLRCARTIFSLLDNITQWKSNLFHKKLTPTEVAACARQITHTKNQVKCLMKHLSKPELADLSYQCQAYARALLYMEEYITNDPSASLQSKLKDFQKYYLALDETDGVEGINAIRESPPSLMDTILNHEAKGQLHYSLSCCENAIKKHPEDIVYPRTLLRCLMNLDQHDTAFNYSVGLVERKKEWKSSIYQFMVEASWKLTDWDNLGQLLKENETLEDDALGVGVGHLLECLLDRNTEQFEKILKEIRKHEMYPLSGSASEQGAYIRGYQHLLRLHMINDLEKFSDFVFKHATNSESCEPDERLRKDYRTLIKEWSNRNDLVQSSLRCQEPLLNLQRVLLSLKHLPIETCIDKAKLSLISAKLARKSHNLQRAYTHLIEAQNLINIKRSLPEDLKYSCIIETAKFNWALGDAEFKENCIKGLKRALESHQPKPNCGDNLNLAKIRLLFTRFSESLSNLDSETLMDMYKETINLRKDWEESYFRLAKYYDRISKTLLPKDPHRPEMMRNAVEQYGSSLEYGSKHVYESMPRLLSIWCDLGSSCNELFKGKRSAKPTNPTKLEQTYVKECAILTSFIGNLKDSLDPHLFYISFPQLVSRICHGNTTISEMLIDILAKLLVNFPEQCMWMLIGVLMDKSSPQSSIRSGQCQKILDKAVQQSHQSDLANLIEHMKKFVKYLIDLCNFTPPEKAARTFQITKYAPKLNELLRSPGFSRILLPYQAFMTVQMKSKYEPKDTFSPFPNHPVYIRKFEDTVEILCSLAKPKKVEISCSDGKKYTIMCKPHDDLRKDCRIMELNSLINRLLKRNPETRKRQLNIRTYTVVPLTNDCGLLEWVNNLKTLKDAITSAWRVRNPTKSMMPAQELRDLLAHTKNGDEAYVVPRFVKVLAAHSPPVFGEYFVQNFPDPTSWYMSKLSYTKSTAVMSVIGYIIGLGDRHPENVLIDSSNGEIVHVDFSLVFNAGENLEYPERVPFRLTHNIISAMGVTGYEGVFRRTCEATMEVMRENKEALMSVLQPFFYDPQLDWKKSNSRSRLSMPTVDKETTEITNTKAAEDIQKIEDRLNGIIKKGSSIPISVSGQVQYLIEEATSKFNLGRMYCGWAAHC